MNMSYCKFQNTLTDLRVCFEDMSDTDELSDEEVAARTAIIKLAIRIVDDFGGEVTSNEDD